MMDENKKTEQAAEQNEVAARLEKKADAFVDAAKSLDQLFGEIANEMETIPAPQSGITLIKLVFAAMIASNVVRSFDLLLQKEKKRLECAKETEEKSLE